MTIGAIFGWLGTSGDRRRCGTDSWPRWTKHCWCSHVFLNLLNFFCFHNFLSFWTSNAKNFVTFLKTGIILATHWCWQATVWVVGLSIFSHFRWTLSDSTLLRFLVFWRRCCTSPARWDKGQVRFLCATTSLHNWRPGAVGESQGGGLHLHPQLGHCAQTQPGQVCV